jgi:glycosyltransferase involved in cell wall biosynthesis
MLLSVIIPVYNEHPYIERVLQRVMTVLPQVEKEIIVVDDGSTDGTRAWLLATFGPTNPHPVTALWIEATGWQVWQGNGQERPSPLALQALSSLPCMVQVIFHEHNEGKGAALRTGFAAATGGVLVIQDADLEYDPRDWAEMVQLIDDGHADVVYGSRFYGKPHRVLYYHHFRGNKLISTLINLLCDVTLSDIEVCYKMFRREVLDSITLTCDDFGFEVEFTVKVTKQKCWRIYEVGVCYYGRTYAEGKKINWRDGLKALWYILKFRLQR